MFILLGMFNGIFEKVSLDSLIPLYNINNINYFKMTSQYYIVFKSVVWKKGDESFQINASLGLGVESNPGPLAPELCVLPCAPLHMHW